MLEKEEIDWSQSGIIFITPEFTTTTVYDIPFTKEKVKELISTSESGKVGLSVIDQTGRRLSCSLNEFINDSYDELVDKKTGFAEYLRDRKK